MHNSRVFESGGVVGTLNLLGDFCYSKAGSDRPSKFRSRTCQELFAILAVRVGESVPRGWIEETLWPGSDGDRQAQNLRKALADLRDALGIEPQSDSVLKVTRDTISLVKGSVDIDSWRTPVALENAGVLVPWVNNSWVVPYRRQFEDKVISQLTQQAAHSNSRDSMQEAKRLCLAVIRAIPLRQEPRESLISLCCRLGERAEAIQHFDDLAEMLDSEFGELPSPSSVVALNTDPDCEELDLDHEAFETYAIGRRSEVKLAAALLTSQPHPVVTIFGPAGIGKSSVALAIMAVLNSSFRTLFVPLGEIRQISEVLPRILHMIGQSNSGPIIETVAHLLSSEPTLLILDNAEHLLPELLPYVETLHSERVRILTTSRHKLNLQNEHLIALDGIRPTPQNGEAPATLFLKYVKESQPGYQPSSSDLSRIYEIVSILDGHPLSVKIAAKFVESLSVTEILSFAKTCAESGFTWNDGFGDIVGSAYNSLSENERLLFRTASLFIGAFSEEELYAAAGCGNDSAGVERLESRALLSRNPDGHLTMLFPLKDFAGPITGQDEVSASFSRLGTYYEETLHDLRVKSNQSDYRQIVTQYRKIERNVLNVVQFFGRDRSAFHLTARIAFHCFIFIPSSPMQSQWLESIKAMEHDEDDTIHLGLYLYVSGSLDIMFGDIIEAVRQTEKAAVIFDRAHRVDAIGARFTAILSRVMRGDNAVFEADKHIPILRDLTSELSSLTEDGKYWGRNQTLAKGYSYLGICFRNVGRPLEAVPVYLECFKISGQMDNYRFMATSAQALADVYLDAGEYMLASRWFETAIKYYDKGESPHMLVQLYESQGYLHCVNNNLEGALNCIFLLQKLQIELKRHCLAHQLSVLAAILKNIDIAKSQECYKLHRDLVIPGTVLGTFIKNFFPSEWHSYQRREQSLILAKVRSQNYIHFVQEHLRISPKELKG